MMHTFCLVVKETILLVVLLETSPRYADDTCFLTSAAPRLSASNKT